jgi:hypothetical protein
MEAEEPLLRPRRKDFETVEEYREASAQFLELSRDGWSREGSAEAREKMKRVLDIIEAHDFEVLSEDDPKNYLLVAPLPKYHLTEIILKEFRAMVQDELELFVKRVKIPKSMNKEFLLSSGLPVKKTLYCVSVGKTPQAAQEGVNECRRRVSAFKASNRGGEESKDMDDSATRPSVSPAAAVAAAAAAVAVAATGAVPIGLGGASGLSGMPGFQPLPPLGLGLGLGHGVGRGLGFEEGLGPPQGIGVPPLALGPCFGSVVPDGLELQPQPQPQPPNNINNINNDIGAANAAAVAAAAATARKNTPAAAAVDAARFCPGWEWSGSGPPSKRRKKQCNAWSAAEEAALKEGVQRYRDETLLWTKILADEDLKGTLAKKNKGEVLKDKYRLLVKKDTGNFTRRGALPVPRIWDKMSALACTTGTEAGAGAGAGVGAGARAGAGAGAGLGAGLGAGSQHGLGRRQGQQGDGAGVPLGLGASLLSTGPGLPHAHGLMPLPLPLPLSLPPSLPQPGGVPRGLGVPLLPPPFKGTMPADEESSDSDDDGDEEEEDMGGRGGLRRSAFGRRKG